MASALEALYSDRDLGRRLGEAGRKRAREFYAWDRLGERMRDIYERVMNRKSFSDLITKDH